jgi:transposase
MSWPASPEAPIPEETFRVAHAVLPKSNVLMRMRDALGPLYSNPQCASLFSHTGQPAEAPARLVMPCAEGLADRQAADAVRSRIDWQDALGLELTDPGFDSPVLRECRTHLIAGRVEPLWLATLRTYLQERGLLKARGTQRTDSAHILAAIRTLDRLAWVGETRRFALNRLAAVAPVWLQTDRQPVWLER